MISLNGLLTGIGLSVVGSFVFAVYTVFALSPKPIFAQGPRTGIDLRLVRSSMLHSPAYWLMVLALLATGCAMIYFSHRASV